MASLFEPQVKALREVMMRVENSLLEPEPDDPRNLDPEDDVIGLMSWAVGDLMIAVDDLDDALTAERRRRNSVLDAMSDEDYQKWEAEVQAKKEKENAGVSSHQAAEPAEPEAAEKGSGSAPAA